MNIFQNQTPLGANVKVELDLSNYATKVDLKNATGVDTSDQLDIDKLKNVPSGLSKLKSKVDNLDVDKLAPVPLDICKLSDAVINYAVKKDVCNVKVKNIEDKYLILVN